MNTITAKELQQVILCHPMATNKDIAEAVGVSEQRVWANRGAMSSNVTRANKNANVNANIEPNVKRQYNKKIKTEIKKEVRICKTTNAPHKNTTIPPKMLGEFLNVKGKKKMTSRQKQVNAVNRSPISNKTMLTLAHKDCLLEIELLKTNPNLRFQSAEIIEETYHEQLATIIKHKLPISSHFGNLRELVECASENQYSHALMDFCCQISKVKDIVKMAIEKNIVEVNGLISLTVNKRISSDWNFVTKMEQLNPPVNFDENTRTEHVIKTFINRIGGMGYAIEEVFNYRDTSSMILFIIRRIE